MVIVRAKRTAHFHFVDPADDERHVFGSRDKDNRESLADRGEWSMFELGREHAFAMRGAKGAMISFNFNAPSIAIAKVAP